jgi:hypothetical protein
MLVNYQDGANMQGEKQSGARRGPVKKGWIWRVNNETRNALLVHAKMRVCD